MSVRKCAHLSLSHGHETCLGCGAKLGTCPHKPCSKLVPLDVDGYIGYHDFPAPCRAVCPGSKHSSVEDVARALPGR
jgi:hypothetical protein